MDPTLPHQILLDGSRRRFVLGTATTGVLATLGSWGTRAWGQAEFAEPSILRGTEFNLAIKFGETADFARSAGKGVRERQWLVGVRMWF